MVVRKKKKVAAKPKAAVKPKRAVRKKAARKKAAKPAGTLQRIENALMAEAAEIDDLAIGLGLLAASGPGRKHAKKRK